MFQAINICHQDPRQNTIQTLPTLTNHLLGHQLKDQLQNVRMVLQTLHILIVAQMEVEASSAAQMVSFKIFFF
jgi:hypothetical protein